MSVDLTADDIQYTRNLARSFRRRWPGLRRFPPEDVEQEAMLGLLRARDSYCPGKSSFTTYAFLCVRGNLINFVRHSSRSGLSRRVLKDPVSHDGPSRLELSEEIRAIIPQSRLRQIYLGVFGMGRTQGEVGADLGIGIARVSQIIRSNLNVIRDRARERLAGG